MGASFSGQSKVRMNFAVLHMNALARWHVGAAKSRRGTRGRLKRWVGGRNSSGSVHNCGREGSGVGVD